MGIAVLKPVVGYEGLYSVSDKGFVFSHISNKWLKNSTNSNGYLSVELFKNGKNTRMLVHRIVAEAFLENPNQYPCVNHKDESKSNNDVNNLEWCSYRYNQNYGTCQERRCQSLSRYWQSPKFREDIKRNAERSKGLFSKPIIQKSKTGETIAEFISINEAMRQTKIRHIHEVCSGKRKSAGGYTWEYKEERM